MACILVELYTGELFFDTHENLEHLAMIEKQCGPLPDWMAFNCSNVQIQRNLNTYSVKNNPQQNRLQWPSAAKNNESVRRVRDMLLLDNIIPDDFGPEHTSLKELLNFMLIIDHKKRPTASECLAHPFFTDFKDNKTENTRNFSKSTEKT